MGTSIGIERKTELRYRSLNMGIVDYYGIVLGQETPMPWETQLHYGIERASPWPTLQV